MDPARELAQLGERHRELLARVGHELLRRRRVLVDLVLDQPQLHRQRDEPLLRAVVEVALEPPPLVVAGGDDPLEPRPRLERDARRRRDRLDQLRVVVERGVVDERGVVVDRRHRPPRLRRRGGRARSRALGSPSARRQRGLQLLAAHRRQPPEQVGEAAAREPRAQQPGEEAGGDERAARGSRTSAARSARPAARPRTSSRHAMPGDAGQHRPPPRPRRARASGRRSRRRSRPGRPRRSSARDRLESRRRSRGRRCTSRKLPSSSRNSALRAVSRNSTTNAPTSTRSVVVASRPPDSGVSSSHTIVMLQRSLEQEADDVELRRLELGEQRLDEQQEARRGHQQAAVAVGPAAPRDQPAGDERRCRRAGTRAVAGDVLVAEDHVRPHHDGDERRERGPQRHPQPRAERGSGEAAQRQRAGSSGGSDTTRPVTRRVCTDRGVRSTAPRRGPREAPETQAGPAETRSGNRDAAPRSHLPPRRSC